MSPPMKGKGIYLDRRNERGVAEAEQHGFWVLPMVAQMNLGKMWQHFGLVLRSSGGEKDFVRIGMFASKGDGAQGGRRRFLCRQCGKSARLFWCKTSR